jgi:hypothetical protein
MGLLLLNHNRNLFFTQVAEAVDKILPTVFSVLTLGSAVRTGSHTRHQWSTSSYPNALKWNVGFPLPQTLCYLSDRCGPLQCIPANLCKVACTRIFKMNTNHCDISASCNTTI